MSILNILYGFFIDYFKESERNPAKSCLSLIIPQKKPYLHFVMLSFFVLVIIRLEECVLPLP